MRRLRESGIVTILLLGLTGCAGVQPRLGWTESPRLDAEDQGSEERPLSRLAFWRRHRAEETVPPASADLPGPSRSTMIAGNGSFDEGNDDDRPGLLRRLPLVGRFWKNGHRDESDELEMPAARYAPGVVSTSSSVALVPPRTPAGTGISASPAPAVTGPSPSGSSVADVRPASPDQAPTPAAVTASTAAERPEEPPPLRELMVDLGGKKPDVDTAAVPARNAGPQQPNLTEPPPVGAVGREDVPPPTAAPGAQPNLSAPDLSPATTNRGPSLPSPSVSSNPSPVSGSSTSGTVISTPGPVWPVTTGETTPIFSGSSQSVIMPSGQGEYVSGGCESPCGAKCKIHKLCPLKKHKAKVYESSVVLPSGQGTVSSCDAPAPCKKECFLKKWLHHKSGCKSKGCKGCKSCSYCGEAPSMVSAQAPIVSPQW